MQIGRKLARTAGRTQRGVTLIEIMIVLAIIGLVMGVLVGPRVIAYFKSGEKKTAWLMTKELESAYVHWQTEGAEPGQTCPPQLDDLVKFTTSNKKDLKDPWGQKYAMKCPDAPTESGFGVYSFGPDKKDGTPDDVHSWDQKQ